MAQPKITNTQLAGPTFDIARVVRVDKTGGVGAFTSIKQAVDSITDATPDNPVAIYVGPGTYVEDTITLKPNILLTSWAGESLTVIESNNPLNTAVIGVNGSSIDGFTILGSTNVGKAGIYFESTLDGPTGTFSASNIQFLGNYIDFHIKGSAFTTYVLADGLYFATFTDDTINHLRVENVPGGAEMQNLFHGTSFVNIAGSGGGGLDAAILVTGSNNSTRFNGLSLQAIAGANAVGDGIVVQDGAYLQTIASSITGYDKNIVVRNVGVAPTVHIAVNLSSNSTLNDLYVEHPGATGVFSGAADISKVFIDPASTVSATYSDLRTTGGTAIVGPLYMAPKHDVVTDMTALINETLSPGLLSGGVISQGINPLDVDVSAGYGYVALSNLVKYMSKVTWPSSTVTVPDDTTSYLYISDMGVVTVSSTPPVSYENIYLGRLRTVGGVITYMVNIPDNSVHYTSALSLFNREALGTIFKSGCIVTENVTPLHINVSSGKYYFSNIVYQPSGGIDRTFYNWYKDAVGADVKGTITTAITNTQYNNVQYGYQIVNVGGTTVGTDPTGLTPATTYTASISVDGGAHIQAVSILGSSATTYADLLIELNADSGGFYTATLEAGNVKITSSLLGTGSSIIITDTDLFSSLTGYVALLPSADLGLVNLTAGYYTKHVLYVSGDGPDEQYGLVIGQHQCTTLLSAQQVALPPTPTPYSEVTTKIAAIIVQQGNANIVEVIDVRPRVGFQSPTTTSAGTHGDLLGLAVDDHTQYLLTNGGRTVTGNLNLGANDITNIGTTTSTNIITGTAALTTNASTGFLWLPSCPGIPTGSPAAPYVNAAATVVDTTNGNLVYRVGTNWVTGMKLTGDSSALGWNDIVGTSVIGGPGANQPTLDIFQGNTRLYAFGPSTENQTWFTYHIRHDYAPGTAIYFHVHWSTTTTAVGTCRWGLEYTIAKGHNQSNFPAPTTIFLEQATAGTAYRHYLIESGPISSAELEVDGIILIRLFRDAGHANDTLTSPAFLMTADIHYQADRYSTKNKAPNFYV